MTFLERDVFCLLAGELWHRGATAWTLPGGSSQEPSQGKGPPPQTEGWWSSISVTKLARRLSSTTMAWGGLAPVTGRKNFAGIFEIN